MINDSGWSIPHPLIASIKHYLPTDSVILEFGSGLGTGKLIKQGYNLLSVEQDFNFINKFHNNYCHATIKDGWYDLEVLHEFLKDKEYDAILIDGPTAPGSRMGILEAKIDFNKIIFMDDIDRPEDRELFCILSEGKKSEDHEFFGVILDD